MGLHWTDDMKIDFLLFRLRSELIFNSILNPEYEGRDMAVAFQSVHQHQSLPSHSLDEADGMRCSWSNSYTDSNWKILEDWPQYCKEIDFASTSVENSLSSEYNLNMSSKSIWQSIKQMRFSRRIWDGALIASAMCYVLMQLECHQGFLYCIFDAITVYNTDPRLIPVEDSV